MGRPLRQPTIANECLSMLLRLQKLCGKKQLNPMSEGASQARMNPKEQQLLH
jgi:hypothetical protein